MSNAPQGPGVEQRRRPSLKAWVAILLGADLAGMIVAGVLSNTAPHSAVVEVVWYLWLIYVAASIAALVWIARTRRRGC